MNNAAKKKSRENFSYPGKELLDKVCGRVGPHPGHGGAREGSGRKKTDTAQVTFSLRRDTIAELRRAGGRQWSKYLQAHLDQYPLPGVLDKKFLPVPARRLVVRTEKDAKAFERMFIRALREAKKNDHNARKALQS